MAARVFGSTPLGDAVINFEKIKFSTSTSGSYTFNLGSQAGSAGESITVEVVQTDGWSTVYGIDFTSETDANIIFTGSNGDDNGNNGDDTVVLGSGDDNVTLRLGNDTITAGAGDDIIDGGAGIDTAIFSW